MDQAAIDIRYLDLLQWLENRFLVPKDWPKRLELISVKKGELIEMLFNKETPEMKKIADSFKIFRSSQSQESFNYNDLMRLFTMLQKTEEAKDKSIFGNYNSKLIYDCSVLVGIYNKNNMYLCELSKIIIQNIGYDIPVFEKNVQANDKTNSDFISKIEDKKAQILKNNENIKNLFRNYEIEETDSTNDLAVSLIKRLSTILKIFYEIESLLKSQKMTEIITTYKTFYKKTYEKEAEEVDQNFIKIISKINKNGDFLISGESNKDISQIQTDIVNKKLNDYLEKYQSGNIQADLEASLWNFKLISENEKDSTKYLTGLLDLKTRKQLQNDLNELLVFITHRINQANNKDELNLNIYQTNLRELSLNITPIFLKESKTFLEQILTLLNRKDFIFLLSIFDDEKNLKIILNSFELLKTGNQNLQKQCVELTSKIEEIRKESIEYEKKILQLKKDSKLIKKQMEKFLIDNLKRKITIIGDINLI
jgi:hypothetical protein